MTATGGTSLLDQAQQQNARPAWSLPNGNAPDIVAQYYLRSDTPTGRSMTPPPPEAREAFRQLLQAGGLVPVNEAAGRLAVSEGGIQDGDMSPFGVPWIEGLPGGMDADQWNALTARARQQSDQRIAEAEATGLFNGQSTLARQQWEAAVRSQDFQNMTARSLADSEIVRRTRELDRLEQERQDAVRTGDLNRAQQLVMSREDLAGQMSRLQASLQQQEAEYARTIQENARQFDVTLGENRRQFDVTQSGWLSGPGGEREATLERERLWTSQQQQAFEQQQAASERAANPRTGLEAWMGGQRAGLNGQAPVNQLTPTTGAPGAFAPPQPPPGFLAAQAAEQTPEYQALVQQYQAAGQAGDTVRAQQIGAQMEQMRQRASQSAFGQAQGQVNAQGVPGATGVVGPGGVLGALPTTAFQQALIEGRPVPQTGQVQAQGRWWDPAALQGVASNLPNTTRTQDFMRGTPSERSAYLGLSSFGGNTDEDTLDRLRRGLPSFQAPTSGRMR